MIFTNPNLEYDTLKQRQKLEEKKIFQFLRKKIHNTKTLNEIQIDYSRN